MVDGGGEADSGRGRGRSACRCLVEVEDEVAELGACEIEARRRGMADAASAVALALLDST